MSAADNAAKARAALAAKRAAGTVKKPGPKRGSTRKPKQPLQYRFNIDEDGSLAIPDQRGAGIELRAPEARRLSVFLARALPPAEQG